ncbi:hypothetical protein BDW74DRAFT_172352 [Aspergillus multicolor]|uniref:uncharacterized protein n=1 Tax=Aspergillus multicolor TaxID=41759 RepID=UPI003CCD0D63
MWKSPAVLVLLNRALAAPATPTERKATTFGMPLARTTFCFIANTIQIGTPPQSVDSFVDWTWIGYHARNPNHFHFFFFFFFYDDLSVGFGSNIQHVGPDHHARVTLHLADMHFQQEFVYSFAGIYGHSPVFSSDNASTQSTFYQMWKQGVYPTPIISFLYCYNSTFNNPAPRRELCRDNDGLRTIGGHSPVLDTSKTDSDPVLWYDNIVFPQVNEIYFEYDPAIHWVLCGLRACLFLAGRQVCF